MAFERLKQTFTKHTNTISYLRRKWTYRAKLYGENLFYAFPIRLIALQLRQYPLLVGAWLFIFGAISGALGGGLGVHYQFLEPEYMGKVNFMSFFMVGAAMGAFIFSYLITLYINVSNKFHFLVLRPKPFFTLALNNFPVLLSFLGLYLWLLLKFEMAEYGGFSIIVAERMGGFLVGVLSVFFLLSGAFFASNKNLFQYFGQTIQQELAKTQKFRGLRFLLSKAHEHEYKVSYYFVLRSFSFRKVEKMHHIETHKIFKVLNQNHGNMLLLMVLFLLLIVCLGYFNENDACQIPAAASVLWALSLLMLIGGSLTFWIRRMGFISILIFMGFIYVFNTWDVLIERNSAFGMSYEKIAVYTWENINHLCPPDSIAADKKSTLISLEKWKKNYQQKYGKNKLPRAIFLCTTGGGTRAAMWTAGSLEKLDSLSAGKWVDETCLMTGASGGMIGLAYMREWLWRVKKGEVAKFPHAQIQANLGKDLINRPFFQAMTDAFLPNIDFQDGKNSYDKEKGYAFDSQLAENLPELAGRRLGDYKLAEENAVIPPLILTPTIVNQGKTLYISPLGRSYLVTPDTIPPSYITKVPGLEFRRFFAENSPDSLWFITALRMNATFPYILPLVSLPSEPEMKTMDAGARDNFGISTAVKYLYEFREWFAANTSEVVFITMRDCEKEDKIGDTRIDGLIAKAISPINGSVYSFMQSGDEAMDYLLQHVPDWYAGNIEVFSIEYPLNALKNHASLSLHLTEKEKRELMWQLDRGKNIEVLKHIGNMYK